MNYREALAWLYGTQRFGIKLGLENTERLFRSLDIPSAAHRIIHVAGTNGKGSVCAMCDSICRAEGYRVGLFTSPHLVSYRERIRVNGKPAGEETVAAGLSRIRDLVADWNPHPTFFEITTAMGLLAFSEAESEIVVLETGMGGRLDATNATTPVVSVVTPIDLDHQKWLGSTLTAIATEKAGIIKPGIPVVSLPQQPEAETVLRATAHARRAPLQFVTDFERVPAVALPGEHQRQNASLAIAALQTAKIVVSAQAIIAGLSSVEWPARFQRWDDRIVIDGAHNPSGARVLAQTWRVIFGQTKATVLLAVLEDKAVPEIVQALAGIGHRFILPQIRSERAVPPTDLARLIAANAPGISCTIQPDVAAAIAEAKAGGSPVLITGSLHFAGEALAHLRGEEYEECAQ